jgi:mono/diheme cytochrome c family protein
MRIAIFWMMVAFLAIFVVNTAAVAAPGAQKGQSLYKTRCAVCHGATGKGDGAAGKALNPKPTNLTDPANYDRWPEPYIYAVVRIGKLQAMKQAEKLGYVALWMPANTDLSHDQVAKLIALIREVQKTKPTPAKLGEITARHPEAYELYKARCQRCHGANMDGKGPDTKPLAKDGKQIPQAPLPPDFRDDLFMSRYTNEALDTIIEYDTREVLEKSRISSMMGLGTKEFTDDALANVYACLRSLSASSAGSKPSK